MADKINPAFFNKPDSILLANTPKANAPTIRDFIRKAAATPTNPIDTPEKAQARRQTVIKDQLATRAAASIANSNNPLAQLLAPNGWGDAGQEFNDSIDRQGGWGLSKDTRKLLGADDATGNGYLSDVKRPVQNLVANAADLLYRGYQTGQAGLETGALGFDKNLDNSGVSNLTDSLTGIHHSLQPGHGALALMDALPDGGLHMIGVPIGRVPETPASAVDEMLNEPSPVREPIATAPEAPAAPPAPISSPAEFADRAAEGGLGFINSPDAIDYYTKNAPAIREELDRRAGVAPTPETPTPEPTPTNPESTVAGAEDQLVNPLNGATNDVTIRNADGVRAMFEKQYGHTIPDMLTPDNVTPGGEPVVPEAANVNTGRPPIEETPNPDPRLAGSINTENLDPTAADPLSALADEGLLTKKRQSRDVTETRADEIASGGPTDFSNDPSFSDLGSKLRAGQKLVEKTANDMIEAAKQYGIGSEEHNQALADFFNTAQRHSANVNETGRGLNTLRNPKGGLAHQDVKNITELANDPEAAGKLNDLIERYRNDPDALDRIARELRGRPGVTDYIKSGFYNAMLSGPQTHVRNILGNTQNLLGDIATRGIASGIGKLPFTNKADRILGREVAARMYGAYRGVAAGLANFKTAYRAATPLDDVSRTGGSTPFHGGASMVLEAPTRALAAEDEVFRSIAQMSDLYGSALRKAVEEGHEGWGKGSSLWDRVDELVENPTDDMMEQANDYGKLMRFQDKPGFIARQAENLVRTEGSDTGPEKAAKLAIRMTAIPFVRTPSSIIRTTMRNSPLGIFSSTNIRDFKAGGAARHMAIARVGAGSAITAGVANMVMNGDITGIGPEDYKKRDDLLATGWKPNSVKVGDRWVSYDNLGPLSALMSSVATGVERYQAGEEEGKAFSDKMASSALGVSDALLQNGWMESLANLFGAMTGPKDQREAGLANTAANLASGLVVPALVRQVNQSYVDPTIRETKGDGSVIGMDGRIMNRIRAATPGLSKSLPPQHDVYGNEVVRENSGGLSILNPITVSKDKNDPVADEVARLDEGNKSAIVGRAPTTINVPGLGNTKLSGRDYQNYQTLSGAIIHDTLSQLVADPTWKTLSDDEKKALVKKATKEGRKEAREQLLSSAPEASPETSSSIIPTAKAGEAPAPAPENTFVGIPTSIRRTPAGNEAVGGVAHSDHLSGDAVDFVPPPGMSMRELEKQAREFFPGMHVLNEGDHVHVHIPGLNGPLFGKNGTKQ